MEEDDDRRNLFDMANSLVVGGPTGTVSIGAVDYTTMDTTAIQTALRSVVFRGGAKSYRTRALRSVCLYVDQLRQSAVSKIKIADAVPQNVVCNYQLCALYTSL